MTNPYAVGKFEAEFQALFSELTVLQNKIREKVSAYAGGKILKGNELVGWLGEIYGKLFLVEVLLMTKPSMISSRAMVGVSR